MNEARLALCAVQVSGLFVSQSKFIKTLCLTITRINSRKLKMSFIFASSPLRAKQNTLHVNTVYPAL